MISDSKTGKLYIVLRSVTSSGEKPKTFIKGDLLVYLGGSAWPKSGVDRMFLSPEHGKVGFFQPHGRVHLEFLCSFFEEVTG
jgi:hypothetical protein